MKWSREERKQKLIEMSDRSPELNEAAGSEIFQMEFVDYTEDDEYIVKYYIKPWQRNPFHNLQGGMLCYYIDAAAGTLSWISVALVTVPTWLERDKNALKGTVSRMPAREDIDMPIEEHLIVELYSK